MICTIGECIKATRGIHVTEQRAKRTLTTIFYADVVDYSRLTGLDEEGTHNRVYGCDFAPTLQEHREAMTEHEGYKQYKIPTRYILRVVDPGAGYLIGCYLDVRLNESLSGKMRVMSSSEVAGFPQAYQYFIKELDTNEVDSIDFILYRYSCNYQKWPLGNLGGLLPTKGRFSI